MRSVTELERTTDVMRNIVALLMLMVIVLILLAVNRPPLREGDSLYGEAKEVCVEHDYPTEGAVWCTRTHAE